MEKKYDSRGQMKTEEPVAANYKLFLSEISINP